MCLLWRVASVSSHLGAGALAGHARPSLRPQGCSRLQQQSCDENPASFGRFSNDNYNYTAKQHRAVPAELSGPVSRRGQRMCPPATHGSTSSVPHGHSTWVLSTCGWDGSGGAGICAFPGAGPCRAGCAGCGAGTGCWLAGGAGPGALAC